MTKGLESCAMGKVMASGHGTLGAAELLGRRREKQADLQGRYLGREVESTSQQLPHPQHRT